MKQNNADKKEADTEWEMKCDMCEQEAQHDVTTTRSLLRLCPDCLSGQERAGVVEGVREVGSFYKGQHEKATREKHWVEQ